jgi:peptidylprolyl isomerase
MAFRSIPPSRTPDFRSNFISGDRSGVLIPPSADIVSMVQKGRNTRLLAISVMAVCSILICLSGCTSQQPVVKAGDTVKVYYSVSFPGGTAFESNKNGTPLEFTVGSNEVVKGFDNAVIGMSPGQTKTVTISSEDAYGPYRPELVNTLSTESVKNTLIELNQTGNLGEINFPGLGPVYIWRTDDNKTGYLRFSNITNETTTVDENHPLAGKDLVFEITLVEIVK